MLLKILLLPHQHKISITSQRLATIIYFLKSIIWENVFDQGNFENKKPEIGLNEVERQGLVSLQILVYYIVITSQMRLLALIEPAEVIGLANVVTR